MEFDEGDHLENSGPAISRRSPVGIEYAMGASPPPYATHISLPWSHPSSDDPETDGGSSSPPSSIPTPTTTATTTRLSPYLVPFKNGSLLGRPRVVSPPPSLRRITTTNSSSSCSTMSTSGGQTGRRPSTSTSPNGSLGGGDLDLAALSNLTITSDTTEGGSVVIHSKTGRRSRIASTSASPENGSGGCCSSTTTTTTASTTAAPSPTFTAATEKAMADAFSSSASADVQTDWRSAFRVPLYSSDGKLMGYKQRSSMLRRQMEVSQPSDLDTTPPESPPMMFNTTSTTSTSTSTPPPLHNFSTLTALEEFAVIAQDPVCGFPDAENQVPGYLLGPVIGRGGFSTVRKALHMPTSLPVAVKVIDKTRMVDPKERDRADREMRVMRQLGGHVAVAQLYECAETPQFLYLFMEHCAGGSLLDHVREHRKLPEHEACVLFQQLLAALQHCHNRGVVHRDIKLENVLLDGRGGLRLIDFGLCGYYAPGKNLRCHCGSPSYAAPEIVARKEYAAQPVDVWSAGVVLYAMLAGFLPFHAKDKKALSRKILQGVWQPLPSVSTNAVDLLRRMLTVDPEQRISLDAIWTHPWLNDSGPRWEGQGEGVRGVLRAKIEPATGAPLPDLDVVATWAAVTGCSVPALLRALKFKECNSFTAGYHLLCEAKTNATAMAVMAIREEIMVHHRCSGGGGGGEGSTTRCSDDDSDSNSDEELFVVL